MQRQRAPTPIFKAEVDPSAQQQQELFLVLLPIRWQFEEVIAALNCPVEQLTPSACLEVEQAFLTIRGVIQMNSIVLDAHPSPLFTQLAMFLRTIEETLVLTVSMREQCRRGQLAHDPTGSFWHVRQYLRHLVQDYQRLLTLLPVTRIADANEKQRLSGESEGEEVVVDTPVLLTAIA